MQHDYQIDELCAAFGVSRSGYYAHLHKPTGQRRREDEALRPKIAAAFHESRQTYGTPRLRAVLTQQEATGISRERIARLMREQGLQPLQKRSFIPRTTQADPTANAAPNLLLDRPATTAPDQVWVSDITYIPTGEGWLYLAAVMDLHTRRILGWATADHMRTELVAEALQRARFTRAGADLTGTIGHSDRGCQYTSGDYRADLALLRMTQSMSRTANCYDNATMGSYLVLLAIKDPDERSFYEIEATNAGWSVPELKRQKASCLYERLALSRDKEGIRRLAKEGQDIIKRVA